ncbi:MAG: hypothetical protein ACJ73J_13155, partial [Actinomycetes bacterium]
NYPSPLVLNWSAVPHAYKYEVQVATDPELASPANGFSKPVETSGTVGALSFSLAAGRYYWAVTPLDADKHKGVRSALGSFVIAWPSTTSTRVTDLDPDERVYDPQFDWDPVPGAARYEVEINTSADFAAGSEVCCSDPTTGTAISPKKVLPNNTGAGGGYFWRVRAIDVDGNAGAWNAGPGFPKYFSPSTVPSISNLRVNDVQTDPPTPLPASGTPDVSAPMITWDPAPGAASYEVQVAPTIPLTTTFAAGSTADTTVTVGSTVGMVPETPISFANSNVRTIVSITDSTHLVLDSPLSSLPFAGSTVTTRLNYCDWTPTSTLEFWDVRTAATGWTPLSGVWNGRSPVGAITQSVSYDPGKSLIAGQRYCVRVRARGDRDAQIHEVVSPWTELGDLTHANPSFRYKPPPAATCSPSNTISSDYRSPVTGQVTARLPLFVWRPIAGACSYFVIVARDDRFTDILDIALTTEPAYAPRVNGNPKTYPDESSSYYWAVVPTPQGNGGGVWSPPENNAPQEFQTRSVPPTLLGPVGGATVAEQPTFHWTATEGARDYHLQVSQDSSFANLLDDVTTDATAFTSSSTYPADTTLHWRVRADDENKVGLAWSSVETFQRRLPAPETDPENPTGGRTIPLLKWAPVAGAISYDLHIDQPDGTQKDFNMRAPAFTPTTHYGTGVWRWKVRANFPKVPFGSTPGSYSPSQPFTRFIGSPAAARGVSTATRTLLSWDPVEMAKSYRVQIAATTSFTNPIETQTTDNTSFAPLLTTPAFADGGKLYWRVASLDEGNTLGGWTTGSFSLPKRIKLELSGNLRRGRKGAVRVKVIDSRGHKVTKAQVRVKGAGVVVPGRRTSRKGMTVFKVRPRHSGKLVFTATRGGYRAGSATLTVFR